MHLGPVSLQKPRFCHLTDQSGRAAFIARVVTDACVRHAMNHDAISRSEEDLMSDNVSPINATSPVNMTEGEWKSRVECAAGHHLLELYHLTDMVEGVLGVRVEDEPDAYLLKTYRTFLMKSVLRILSKSVLMKSRIRGRGGRLIILLWPRRAAY